MTALSRGLAENTFRKAKEPRMFYKIMTGTMDSAKV